MSLKPNRPAKRILVRPQRGVVDEVTVIPTLDALMNDALAIIGGELAQYRQKSKRGATLDLKEARAVQAYMDALIKLSKENREQAKSEDLSDLSDQDMLQLANEVLKNSPALESDQAKIDKMRVEMQEDEISRLKQDLLTEKAKNAGGRQPDLKEES